MKNFKNKNLLIIIFASALFSSCAKDDETNPVPVTVPTPVDTTQADRTFEVSNTGAAAYVFQFSNIQNPELELIRGNTYTFNVNSPGHPFLINTINTLGKDNMYTNGVMNNGTANGTIEFTVPLDAPNILWYNCEFHVPMVGRIRIVDKGVNRAFQVGNNGGASYTFSGSGLNSVENTNFTFKRGESYTLSVSAPGHPFIIKSIQGVGAGNAYNEGVTNNGTANGTIAFTVPQNAPNTLFYNCEFHGSMTGSISIID